jgi:HSP20 family protein
MHEPRGEWQTEDELVRRRGDASRLDQRAIRRLGRSNPKVFPPIIISAKSDEMVVRAEVPGMDLDELDVSVSGDTLSIRGTRTTGGELEGGWYHRRERESGSFRRAVRLPAEVDGARADATYVAGVLAIRLPLREAAKPREIPVKVVEG